METICDRAGLPIEPHKSMGPTTLLTFLGIEIDSHREELRLPPEKIRALKQTLANWQGKKACRKRDLLSLIGSLSHACKVVRPGRIFLRRLIDLSTLAKNPEHFIRLNHDARSDIEWWASFIEDWNGTAILRTLVNIMPEITMIADASGTWGCGAVYGSSWLQLPWGGLLINAHISIKEMVPIVIGTAIWGKYWKGRSVRILSDNTVVVAAINTNTSKVREIAHLLRCLAFISAHWQCHLSAAHVPGAQNSVADAISRNNMVTFRVLHPQAAEEPEQIPMELVQLLITESPDWTSTAWTQLWKAIFRKDWPPHHAKSTKLESVVTQSSAGNFA